MFVMTKKKRNLSTYDLRIIKIANTLPEFAYRSKGKLSERSFTALRRLNTYSEVNKERTSRLSGLALMHIHKHEVSLNSEHIAYDGGRGESILLK